MNNRVDADGFVIMTPQNEKWADCIEECSRMRRRYPGMP